MHMQFISSWEAFDSVLELRFNSTLYIQSPYPFSCHILSCKICSKFILLARHTSQAHLLVESVVLTSDHPEMQGKNMVQNKEYVIQESATRREIGRSNPWEASS